MAPPMVERAFQAIGGAAGTAAYIVGLMVFIGAAAHALGWLLTRRRAAAWVWGYWSLLGTGLFLAGLGSLGYGWLVLGLQTSAGSALAGVGLLLASAGLWMIVPL
jgi:hypothetical protein